MTTVRTIEMIGGGYVLSYALTDLDLALSAARGDHEDAVWERVVSLEDEHNVVFELTRSDVHRDPHLAATFYSFVFSVHPRV
jgi:hypothetical protein